MAVLIREIMAADGQLLWKPRASHESHLANFGRMAERGGHDARGGWLPPGAEGNSGRVGCAGPGDEHRTYAGAVACSAGQSRRRGGFMRGGWSAVVWCGDDMPRKGWVEGGRHGIVHHRRNTRAQIWWVRSLRFLRSDGGSQDHSRRIA